MDRVKEEVTVKSNRITLGVHYNFPKSKSSRLQYKVGMQLGTDFRTLVDYKIVDGTWSYSAVYPQYNMADTVFNNLWDYNKPGSASAKSYTFQNSTNNILVGFGAAASLGFKKIRMFHNLKTVRYRYNLNGSLFVNRLYQSYSTKDFGSAFPMSFDSKYNSFMFRSDRFALNQITLNIGLTYTL
jgi:hypothetical protein